MASPITAIVRATREVMSLEGAGFSLTCTTDHPLYDPLAKTWAPAGDWVLGQRSSLLQVPEDGSPPQPVEVHARQVSAGLSEVFDLTVLHPLHNFVAAGVLVHNKSFPESCELPSEGTKFAGAACTCADAGSGTVDCNEQTDAGVRPTCVCQ